MKRKKNLNKNYVPLDPPPDKKAKYKIILQWTRNKQTFWYIAEKGIDYVVYVLQGNDGHNIYLEHYKDEKWNSKYAFRNLPGHYTYKEYKALEDAILEAGLKKPLSQDKYREKQALERKKQKEKIERYKYYWNSLKNETQQGKCKWEFYKVSRDSRLFRTRFYNKGVTFEVVFKQGDKQPVYYVKSDGFKETLSIDQNSGIQFERLLLSNCKYGDEVVHMTDCHKRTALKYRNFLLQRDAEIKAEQKRKIQEQERREKNQRRRLYTGMRDILLKTYDMPDGSQKLGMDILAADRSGALLKDVSGVVFPVNVNQFTDSISEFLDCINQGSGIYPEIQDIYRNIINVFTLQYAAQGFTTGNVILSGKSYNKNLTNLKKQQEITAEVREIDVLKSEEAGSDTRIVKETDSRRVNTHDFVIRSSVLSCMYKSHSIINIDAVIKSVDKELNFIDIIVPAGYCQQCQKFFILESDYSKLKLRGEPLCTVIEEQQYKKNYMNNKYFEDLSAWPEKSILAKCGYNVNQSEGLTTFARRKILANVIDQEILSKIEIRSHLRKQIALHSRHQIAVDKWESDDDFVAAYNKGYYAKYGVSVLKRLSNNV